VVKRGSNTQLYSARASWSFSKRCQWQRARENSPMRFSVQYVIRPNLVLSCSRTGERGHGASGQEIVALNQAPYEPGNVDHDVRRRLDQRTRLLSCVPWCSRTVGQAAATAGWRGQFAGGAPSFESSVGVDDSRDWNRPLVSALKHTTQTLTARCGNIPPIYRVEVTNWAKPPHQTGPARLGRVTGGDQPPCS